MNRDLEILAARKAWEDALAKERPKDALDALRKLETLEPQEPAWSQRRGDVLRRMGRAAEAEAAFVQAVRAYVARGFLTRAAALAKMVVGLNPARADLLAELDPAPTKQLREAHRPAAASPLKPRLPAPPRTPSGTMPAVSQPSGALPVPRQPTSPKAPVAAAAPPAAQPRKPAAQPVRPPPNPPATQGDFDEDERPTLVAGVRADKIGVVAAATGLEPARDSHPDETRFENTPDVFAVEVDLSELESSSPQGPDAVFSGEGEAPTAVRLALMSGAALFADVSRGAMSELVKAAELVELDNGTYVFRQGAPADGLYVLVEGKVILAFGSSKRALALSEGQVFGEDCLLHQTARTADARAAGRVLALRIGQEQLDAVVRRHASVGDVLFELLILRLVTNALQTSELFAPFDVPTRKELGRMFEVRRASAGTVIKERGKRSDGLYLALAGEFEAEEEDGAKRMLLLGTMFGHTSLVSDAPERRTVVARTEAVVLRLAAARFLGFVARFPAALAHLTELAKKPEAL